MSQFEECHVIGVGDFACDDYTWSEYDARGIYLCRVCKNCVADKLSKFRKDVLHDPHYDCDEPIEPEDY